VNFSEVTPLLKSALEGRMYDQRAITYLSVTTIVTAIFDAASRIAGGQAGDHTNKALKTLRNRLLPELEEDVERSAAQVEGLLKHEADKGPMRVQRLDYEGRKKPGKVVR
jgi:hypothetical protein